MNSSALGWDKRQLNKYFFNTEPIPRLSCHDPLAEELIAQEVSCPEGDRTGEFRDKSGIGVGHALPRSTMQYARMIRVIVQYARGTA